jgi:hypothetical protein
MAKVKVFSGYGFLKGVCGQVKIIVATTSKKRASELTKLTASTIKDYFSESSNTEHLLITASKIDTVFYSKKGSTEWVEYPQDLVQ